MVDMVIRNGKLLQNGELTQADVIVDGSRIVGLSGAGIAPRGQTDIDASGLLVLPGIIDTHVHFREPGYEYKEDFESGSRAAAAGGITMFVDMPNLEPPPNTVERFQAQNDLAQSKSYVDFNHWASPTRLGEIPKLAQTGCAGFKFFMKAAHYPYRGEISITDHAEIMETLRAIAKTGLMAVVHPHNQMLWEHRVAARRAEGKIDPAAWSDATYGDDDVVETTAIATLAILARAVQARLRILHIQGLPQLRLTRALKTNGYPFIAETNPWAVVRIDPIGLQSEENVVANWQAMEDGTIDLIGSDHAPHTKEEHERSRVDAFDSVIAGYPLCEHWASIFLTGVNEGRLSLRRFVELTASNPAKNIGLYPRKGAIHIGSDADFTLVDMNREAVLGDTYPVYSKIGFTPLEGLRVKGVPEYTIVRGTVVMAHGQVVGSPGYGEFITTICMGDDREQRQDTAG